MPDKATKDKPAPPPGAHLMCAVMSPDLPIPPPAGFTLARRVKCNRLAGHEGPHRQLRARDFTTAVEWEGGRYTRPVATR